MRNWRSIKLRTWLAVGLALIGLGSARADSGAPDLKRLERSFSVHASLVSPAQGATALSLIAPTETEIRNAARLLSFDYAANRIYLIYQKEISIAEVQSAFQIWRQACPVEVELVPALVLTSNDTNRTEVFTAKEIQLLVAFFKKEVNPRHLAVVNSSVQQHKQSLRALAAAFGERLIRLGLQPDEPLAEPFVAAVEEVSKGLCQGTNNAAWQQPEGGREGLRKCVQARNDHSLPIAWNLGVASAGTNVQKNTALPSGRNTLAAGEILHFATPGLLAGFSTDLQLLQINSRAFSHDGSAYSFYEMLKQGHVYVGYYARPFHEIVKIYQTLRSGKSPGR